MKWIAVAGYTWINLLGNGISGPAENAVARQEQVTHYLKKCAAEVTENALAGINTLEDWEAVSANKRREYLYMLGLDPMPPRTPLEAQVTGTLQTPEYRVEKIVFQSSPKLFVTGNFYVPNETTAPLPTILYVCGHSPHPLGAKYHYQDRAQWFAEHGYACLIIDTLEFGEVAGIHHGLHNLNMWHWLSTGYTPAGVEVWNAMRAIDYLETREEVDSTRIGITGISGGGAVSWYAAAADERIAVAVPVCGTFTYGSQAKNWLADGQCDCIYFNNTYQADLSVMGALIAPRPLMTCSGIKDSIFPPDGYHEVYRQTKRIYDLYERDAIRDIDDDVPHQDSPKLRQETRQWFNRWLKNDTTPVERLPNPEDKRHTAEELACLTAMPWDAANFSVHDHFVARLQPSGTPDVDQWTVRKHQVLTELQDKTFRWFPKQRVTFHPLPNGGHGSWLGRYGDYEDIQIQTEQDVYIRVQLIKAKKRSAELPLLMVVKRPTDTLSTVDVDELLPLLGHCDIALVNPRLTDHTISQQDYANLERTAVWSGRTIAAMQVWDLVRAAEWLSETFSLQDRGLALYAKGDMTVPAVYATALSSHLTRLFVRDLPASQTLSQAPPLLNVLRFTDIPEIAAMVTPGLAFIGNYPAGFERTKHVHDMHDRPNVSLTAKSLPEAMFPSPH